MNTKKKSADAESGQTPPAESIPETAERLAQGLTPPAEPTETPKKKGRGGRRPGAGRKPKAERDAANAAAEQAERDSRIQVLAAAFTVTGATLTNRFDMEPRFGEPQGRVLAEAWDPVIMMYLKDGGPWVVALSTTGVMLFPYAIQILQRLNAARAKQGREVANVATEKPA